MTPTRIGHIFLDMMRFFKHKTRERARNRAGDWDQRESGLNHEGWAWRRPEDFGRKVKIKLGEQDAEPEWPPQGITIQELKRPNPSQEPRTWSELKKAREAKAKGPTPRATKKKIQGGDPRFWHLDFDTTDRQFHCNQVSCLWTLCCFIMMAIYWDRRRSTQGCGVVFLYTSLFYSDFVRSLWAPVIFPI